MVVTAESDDAPLKRGGALALEAQTLCQPVAWGYLANLLHFTSQRGFWLSLSYTISNKHTRNGR
jgi:hypothetical protein